MVWYGESEVSRRRFYGRAAKLRVRLRDAGVEGKCTGQRADHPYPFSSSLMQVPLDKG